MRSDVRMPRFKYGYHCPYCEAKIANHTPSDYGNDEVHCCEHCGKKILWTPMWSMGDIRD